MRRGQKAADLIKSKMAELPKDEPAVSSAFYFQGRSRVLFSGKGLVKSNKERRATR